MDLEADIPTLLGPPFGERLMVGQPSRLIWGVLDLEPTESLGVLVTEPRAHVATSQPVAVGEVVTARGIRYVITRIESDGTGVSVLWLRR